MIIPTETVYGLAGVFSDIGAITRIFKAKERPLFNPLIVHVADLSEVDELAAEVPALARELARRLWPGPLTLVLKKKPIVPDLITAGLDTVAIRMPNHPVALDVIRAAGLPLAAPSANLFGQLSPTRVEDIDVELWKRTDGVVDGGPCSVGVESTVIEVHSNHITLLRPGGISMERLRSFCDRIEIPEKETELAAQRRSPGRILHHYSPRTPLFFDDKAPDFAGKKVGWLLFKERNKNIPAAAPCEILSSSGNLDEAAHNLFAALKRLDSLGLDVIIAEKVPASGLGYAINDRLERASSSTLLP